MVKLCELEKRKVPQFVMTCIKEIESKEENLKTDGLYRLSGNLGDVQTIRCEVNKFLHLLID